MLWDCPRCGTEALRSVEQRECPECRFPMAGESHDLDAQRGFANAAGTRRSPKRKSIGFRITIAGLILVGSIVITTLFFFVMTPAIQVRPLARNWVRHMNLLEFTEVRHSSWKDQIPPGTQVPNCTLKERSKKTVPDGETCQSVREDSGDGSFQMRRVCAPRTREIPVQDLWCDYVLQQWTFKHTLQTRGDYEEPEYWPAKQLTFPEDCLGCQKLEQPHTIYQVELVDNNGIHYYCTVPKDRWDAMNPESLWQAKKNVDGNQLRCDSFRLLLP